MKGEEKMENMSLKEYAKQARKRLMTGYWENISKDRANFLKSHYSNNDNISQLKSMFKRKVEREIFGAPNNSPDEQLYAKVVNLLSQNEYVLNPIMQLIDHEVYDKLDDNGKQNYIFELTDKYNELKHRFDIEYKKNDLIAC